jgi:hypothetical protein
MDAALRPVVVALGDLDDEELHALIATVNGVTQIAPGLLAWIERIPDWEITSRYGVYFPPTTRCTAAALMQIPHQMPKVCPRCGGEVARIPRRLIDRVISLVRPVQRYRCTALQCQWIGNLSRGPVRPNG